MRRSRPGRQPGWAARTGRCRSAARGAGASACTPELRPLAHAARRPGAGAHPLGRAGRARGDGEHAHAAAAPAAGTAAPARGRRGRPARRRRRRRDLAHEPRRRRGRPVRLLARRRSATRSRPADRAASARACATSRACARWRSGSRTRRCTTPAAPACGCADEGGGRRRRAARVPRERGGGAVRGAAVPRGDELGDLPARDRRAGRADPLGPRRRRGPDGAARTGSTPVATVALGTPNGCPAVASRPNGAAVLAAATEGGISVVVREPGGAWGAPATIAADKAFTPEVAINARGDAIVTWGEYRTDYRLRIHAARPPGGRHVRPGRDDRLGRDRLRRGLRRHAATARRSCSSAATDVRLTSAPMGSAFPPGRVLLPGTGPHSPGRSRPRTDGRVLIAAAGEKGLVRVRARARRRRVRAPPGDPRREQLRRRRDRAARRRRGGRDLGARDRGRRDGARGAGRLRTAGRGFTEERREAARYRDHDVGVGLYRRRRWRPAVRGAVAPARRRSAPTGSALLGWGIQDGGVRAATVTAAGLVRAPDAGDAGPRPGRDHAAGARRRAPRPGVDGQRPDLLRPAVRRPSALRARGRTGVAGRAAPEIGVGAPRDRTLRPGQPLVLPVRCSAACDLRGALDDEPGRRPGRVAGRARARRCCGSGLRAAGRARDAGRVRRASCAGRRPARAAVRRGHERVRLRRAARAAPAADRRPCARGGWPAGGSRCAGARTARRDRRVLERLTARRVAEPKARRRHRGRRQRARRRPAAAIASCCEDARARPSRAA